MTSPWKAIHLEVQPEHTLFVRFVDGTAGLVQCAERVAAGRRGDVFDVLVERFADAHLENGVITWPGEIDLAPDAVWEVIRRDGVYQLGAA